MFQLFKVAHSNPGDVILPDGQLEPPHYDGVQCLAFSGDLLFSGSRTSQIKKWMVNLDRGTGKFTGTEIQVRPFCFFAGWTSEVKERRVASNRVLVLRYVGIGIGSVYVVVPLVSFQCHLFSIQIYLVLHPAHRFRCRTRPTSRTCHPCAVPWTVDCWCLRVARDTCASGTPALCRPWAV